MLRLVVLDDEGHPVASYPIGSEAVQVGRRPSNHLVLPQRSVSARHASFWVSGGEVWVEDLRSRNGTFRPNGARIRTPTRLAPGDSVRIGHDVWIRVEGTPKDRPAADAMPMVCLADGSASFPIHGSRFVIGPGPSADVQVEGVDEVTLTLHPTGELWLGRDDDESGIAFGEAFEVGGRRFVVTGSPTSVSATWDVERELYPYRLQTTLDGAHGAHAVLSEPSSGLSHAVAAENRAVMLYLLARQLTEHRTERKPATHEGWIADAELATGIWGRAGAGRNLNVLVTRVRQELKAAGFNPWFIEKRRGYTRVQLQDLRLS